MATVITAVAAFSASSRILPTPPRAARAGVKQNGLRSVNYPPLRSPRKFDDVELIISLGGRLGHPLEGKCLKMTSEFLIVGQFGQTYAFPCEVGVLVLGSHGERSRFGLPSGMAGQPLARNTSSFAPPI